MRSIELLKSLKHLGRIIENNGNINKDTDGRTGKHDPRKKINSKEY